MKLKEIDQSIELFDHFHSERYAHVVQLCMTLFLFTYSHSLHFSYGEKGVRKTISVISLIIVPFLHMVGSSKSDCLLRARVGFSPPFYCCLSKDGCVLKEVSYQVLIS